MMWLCRCGCCCWWCCWCQWLCWSFAWSPQKKQNTCSSFCDARVLLRGTKELVHKNPGKINLWHIAAFRSCTSSRRVGWWLLGDELLGMDGGRYLKLDDFKDQDDDFLSPKRTMRDFESGMGTTWVIRLSEEIGENGLILMLTVIDFSGRFGDFKLKWRL